MPALKKKQDYISWDEYFMGVALLSARRSKDPNTQVGACIVNNNGDPPFRIHRPPPPRPSDR